MPKTSHIKVMELVGREFQPVTVEIYSVNPEEGTFSYLTPDGAQHSVNPLLLYLHEALAVDFKTAWQLIHPLIDVPGMTLSLVGGTVSKPHRLPITEYDWSFIRDSSEHANALMLVKIADSPVHDKMKALGLWSAAWVDKETYVSSLERPRPIIHETPKRRSESPKYDPKLSVKEIAVRIRADIKAAITRGEIPAVKTSVRSDRNSIDVTIVSWPKDFQVSNAERVIHDHLHPNQSGFIDDRELPYHTDAARSLIKKIESMRNAYNFDDSDPMTDYFHVNYYGGTHIDWEAEHAERKKILQGLPRYVPGMDARINAGPFAGWYKIFQVYEDENGLNVELARKDMDDHVIVNGSDLANLHLME